MRVTTFRFIDYVRVRSHLYSGGSFASMLLMAELQQPPTSLLGMVYQPHFTILKMTELLCLRCFAFADHTELPLLLGLTCGLGVGAFVPFYSLLSLLTGSAGGLRVIRMSN